MSRMGVWVLWLLLWHSSAGQFASAVGKMPVNHALVTRHSANHQGYGHSNAGSHIDKRQIHIDHLNAPSLHHLAISGDFQGLRDSLTVLSQQENFPHLLGALQAHDGRGMTIAHLLACAGRVQELNQLLEVLFRMHGDGVEMVKRIVLESHNNNACKGNSCDGLPDRLGLYAHGTLHYQDPPQQVVLFGDVTPMECAAAHGHVQAMKLLVQAGVAAGKASEVAQLFNLTPQLHKAIQLANTEGFFSPPQIFWPSTKLKAAHRQPRQRRGNRGQAAGSKRTRHGCSEQTSSLPSATAAAAQQAGVGDSVCNEGPAATAATGAHSLSAAFDGQLASNSNCQDPAQGSGPGQATQLSDALDLAALLLLTGMLLLPVWSTLCLLWRRTLRKRAATTEPARRIKQAMLATAGVITGSQSAADNSSTGAPVVGPAAGAMAKKSKAFAGSAAAVRLRKPASSALQCLAGSSLGSIVKTNAITASAATSTASDAAAADSNSSESCSTSMQLRWQGSIQSSAAAGAQQTAPVEGDLQQNVKFAHHCKTAATDTGQAAGRDQNTQDNRSNSTVPARTVARWGKQSKASRPASARSTTSSSSSKDNSNNGTMPSTIIADHLLCSAAGTGPAGESPAVPAIGAAVGAAALVPTEAATAAASAAVRTVFNAKAASRVHNSKKRRVPGSKALAAVATAPVGSADIAAAADQAQKQTRTAASEPQQLPVYTDTAASTDTEATRGSQQQSRVSAGAAPAKSAKDRRLVNGAAALCAADKQAAVAPGPQTPQHLMVSSADLAAKTAKAYAAMVAPYTPCAAVAATRPAIYQPPGYSNGNVSGSDGSSSADDSISTSRVPSCSLRLQETGDAVGLQQQASLESKDSNSHVQHLQLSGAKHAAVPGDVGVLPSTPHNRSGSMHEGSNVNMARGTATTACCGSLWQSALASATAAAPYVSQLCSPAAEGLQDCSNGHAQVDDDHADNMGGDGVAAQKGLGAFDSIVLPLLLDSGASYSLSLMAHEGSVASSSGPSIISSSSCSSNPSFVRDLSTASEASNMAFPAGTQAQHITRKHSDAVSVTSERVLCSPGETCTAIDGNSNTSAPAATYSSAGCDAATVAASAHGAAEAAVMAAAATAVLPAFSAIPEDTDCSSSFTSSLSRGGLSRAASLTSEVDNLLLLGEGTAAAAAEVLAAAAAAEDVVASSKAQQLTGVAAAALTALAAAPSAAGVVVGRKSTGNSSSGVSDAGLSPESRGLSQLVGLSASQQTSAQIHQALAAFVGQRSPCVQGVMHGWQHQSGQAAGAYTVAGSHQQHLQSYHHQQHQQHHQQQFVGIAQHTTHQSQAQAVQMILAQQQASPASGNQLSPSQRLWQRQIQQQGQATTVPLAGSATVQQLMVQHHQQQQQQVTVLQIPQQRQQLQSVSPGCQTGPGVPGQLVQPAVHPQLHVQQHPATGSGNLVSPTGMYVGLQPSGQQQMHLQQQQQQQQALHVSLPKVMSMSGAPALHTTRLPGAVMLQQQPQLQHRQQLMHVVSQQGVLTMTSGATHTVRLSASHLVGPSGVPTAATAGPGVTFVTRQVLGQTRLLQHPPAVPTASQQLLAMDPGMQNSQQQHQQHPFKLATGMPAGCLIGPQGNMPGSTGNTRFDWSNLACELAACPTPFGIAQHPVSNESAHFGNCLAETAGAPVRSVDDGPVPAETGEVTHMPPVGLTVSVPEPTVAGCGQSSSESAWMAAELDELLHQANQQLGWSAIPRASDLGDEGNLQSRSPKTPPGLQASPAASAASAASAGMAPSMTRFKLSPSAAEYQPRGIGSTGPATSCSCEALSGLEGLQLPDGFSASD